MVSEPWDSIGSTLGFFFLLRFGLRVETVVFTVVVVGLVVVVVVVAAVVGYAGYGAGY